LPPLGVLDIGLDDVFAESVDEAALPMSGAELAAGMAAALESAAVLSVLLAGCEHPARARPAIAARMARVETIGARRAWVFEKRMRELRLNAAKTHGAVSCSKR
jgi:hypothetical protein